MSSENCINYNNSDTIWYWMHKLIFPKYAITLQWRPATSFNWIEILIYSYWILSQLWTKQSFEFLMLSLIVSLMNRNRNKQIGNPYLAFVCTRLQLIDNYWRFRTPYNIWFMRHPTFIALPCIPLYLQNQKPARNTLLNCNYYLQQNHWQWNNVWLINISFHIYMCISC